MSKPVVVNGKERIIEKFWRYDEELGFIEEPDHEFTEEDIEDEKQYDIEEREFEEFMAEMKEQERQEREAEEEECQSKSSKSKRKKSKKTQTQEVII